MKTEIESKEKPRNKSQKILSNKIYKQIKRNQIKPTNKSEVETDKPEVSARNRQRRRACELWLGRKRRETQAEREIENKRA